MPEPKVKLFEKLRDRFEEGGLIYTPSFDQNTYTNDFLSEEDFSTSGDFNLRRRRPGEYDPLAPSSEDLKQPNNPQGQSDDYSVLDGVGERENTFKEGAKYEGTDQQVVQPNSSENRYDDYSRLDGKGEDGITNKYSNEFSAVQDFNAPQIDSPFDLSSRRPSEYDPLAPGSQDLKQPNSTQGQDDDYSALDGIGENADPDYPNTYTDSDIYSPRTDAKDEKFSATQTQNSVSRKKDSFVSPNSDLTKNKYSNEFSALQDLGDPETNTAFDLKSKRSSEYDPIAPGSDDKKHTVGTGPNETQTGVDYSRLDLYGERLSHQDPRGNLIENYYLPEGNSDDPFTPGNPIPGGTTYLDQFQSRTGVFEDYD